MAPRCAAESRSASRRSSLWLPAVLGLRACRGGARSSVRPWGRPRIALVALSVLLQIGALLTRDRGVGDLRTGHRRHGQPPRLTRSGRVRVPREHGSNGSVGIAVRIASLRRAAPQTTPRAPALVAAEVPIITVELALVAIFSFTLVAPLGVPLWVPALDHRGDGRPRRRAAPCSRTAIGPGSERGSPSFA